MEPIFHKPERLRHISKSMHGMDAGNAFAMLLSYWNYATAPYVLRTDEEHAYCRKLARAIIGRIKRLGFCEFDWQEFSNGMRFVA